MSLGYDQCTINTVSFFKEFGANLGVFSGLINEVMPPWVVVAMGAAVNLFGYLMVGVTVWLVCLYFLWAPTRSHSPTRARW